MMSRGEQHYRIKTIKKSEPNESEDFKESLVSYHEQLDEKTSLSRSRKVDVTQRGKSSRKVISQSLGKVFKLSCTTGSPIQ